MVITDNMIKLLHYNQSHIQVDCEYDEAQEISEIFSFYTPNYMWSNRYKSGIWDGKVRLFSTNDCLLPYGLLYKLLKYFKANDIEYQIDPVLLETGHEISSDEIVQFCDEVLKSDLVPRDYQVKAVQYFMYHKKMIGLSATASGKSFIYYIFFNLLRYIYPDFKSLLLVPRISLTEQMAGDFQDYAKNLKDYSQDVHKIYAGKEKYTDKPITISTWQSLKNMPPEYYKGFNAVVIDETHEATADCLPRIANHCINAHYRIGMTGHIQECKIAKIQLNALLGNIKTFSKSSDLIKKGILSDLMIKCIVLKYSDEINKQFAGRKKKEYQEEMKIIQGIPERKRFICKLAASRNNNTMVLFKIREYGRDIYRLLKHNFKNKKVFYIDGTVKVDYREKVREVAEKYDDVIIVASYGTFSTGINIRNLQSLIFAESVLSSVKVIQSVGRVLRRYGSTKSTLYDVADDLTYKNRKNYVLKHFLKRIKYYDGESFDYDVTTEGI